MAVKKIFRARHLVSCNENHDVFDDGFLAIEGDKILDVGPWAKRPRAKSFRVIERPDHILMPGLFNLHCHLAMSLMKGVGEDVPLTSWLNDYVFPLEKKWVSPSFVKVGTQLALAELIKGGVTFVADMYFHQKVAAKVFDEAGVRGCLGLSFFDQGAFDHDSLESVWEAIPDLINEFKKYDKLELALAPHAPYTCSVKTLETAAELAKELALPCMIHVAETKKEAADIKRQTGESPLGLVQKAGLLEAPYCLIAHGLWLDEADYHRLKNNDCTVVINAHSNAKLGSGIPPIQNLYNRQIPFALGTDGSASNNNLDIWAEINFLSKLHHLTQPDLSSLPGKVLIDAATRWGARAVGKEKELGSLEPGKQADFILIDTLKAHLRPITDVYAHLVHSVRADDVDSVYVAGQALMEKRKLKTIDEPAAIQAADALWKKIIKSLGKKDL